MRLTFALTLLIAFAGSSVSFAASDRPATPVAAETTTEDTAPATTYGAGCPFGGYEDTSTEEVVS